MEPNDNKPVQPTTNNSADPLASAPVTTQEPAAMPAAAAPADSPATPPVSGAPENGPTVTPPQQTPVGAQPPNTPMTASAPNGSKKAGLKKLGVVPIIAIVIALLATIGAGAYFGVIVPNSPENVWEKSLQNTSKGFDRLVEYTKQQKDSKGAQAKGDFNIESSGVVVDGTFEAKTYEKNGTYKADIGAAGARISMEALSTVPDGSSSPDVYFKFNGLASVGSILGAQSPELSTYFSQLDNQWYVIDHTLFDQLEASATNSEAGNTPELSTEDLAAIQEAVTKVNKEYLFTTQPDKAVFEVANTVGKETVDGRQMYHYQVVINKANFKAYVTAMKDALKGTKVGQIYATDGRTFEEAIGFDELIKSIDEMQENSKADVWADISAKLIRKVKFTAKENDKNWLEVSLNYTGGSVYPFAVTTNTDENGQQSKLVLSFEIDTQKNTTKLGVDATMTEDTQNAKVTINATTQPNNDPVEFTKPADAASVYELLGGLMPGASQGALPTSSSLGSFDL